MMVGKFVKQNLIATLAKSLAPDGDIWKQVQTMVYAMEDSTLPGPEKKQKVLEGLKTIGLEAAGWLLQLLIELAVAYIRVGVK